MMPSIINDWPGISEWGVDGKKCRGTYPSPAWETRDSVHCADYGPHQDACWVVLVSNTAISPVTGRRTCKHGADHA